METSNPIIRLFIIEDNANIIVPGMRNLFRGERDGIRVTGYASNVEETIKMGDPETFDLLILDLWIPNTSPIENLQKLRRHFPGKPVIIYTHDSNPIWRRKMLGVGAMAYLIKDATREELKMAFEKVAAGETWISGLLANEEKIEIIRLVDHQGTPLSPVQLETVDLLSRGLKRDEIAKKLNMSTGAIDKMLLRLRLQFEVKTNYELIRYFLEKALI